MPEIKTKDNIASIVFLKRMDDGLMFMANRDTVVLCIKHRRRIPSLVFDGDTIRYRECEATGVIKAADIHYEMSENDFSRFIRAYEWKSTFEQKLCRIDLPMEEKEENRKGREKAKKKIRSLNRFYPGFKAFTEQARQYHDEWIYLGSF